MRKLSDKSIDKILDTISGEDNLIDFGDFIIEPYNLDEKQRDYVKKLFREVIRQPQYQNYNMSEQTQIVETIAQQFDLNQDVVPTFNQVRNSMLSVRHMDYYDRNLGNGEASNIINVLNKNGIDLNVLKGVKMQDLEITKDNVTIYQNVDYDSDGYKYVEQFSIYKDGNKIYDFKAGRKMHNLEREANKYSNYITKSGRKSDYRYVNSFFKDGRKIDVVFAEDKKGNWTKRYLENGRFTKI